ncbi:MAG TPA: L,D-transpeptidase [Mycobacteriales bacterium]|nr:L,D-transpeptidase [Mycobacteriales bacterium]
MTPAHTARTTLAAVIAATLALGVFAALYRGPLGVHAASSAVADHSDGQSLKALLTGPLSAASLQSRPAQVSEGAPTRLLSPCRSNRSAQSVKVSIKQQHLWACHRAHLVMSTPVTTGRSQPGDATPRGTFAVEARVANTTLRPANGNKVHVTYWIPFSHNIYGFHDAPWQSMPYGSSRYRTEGSIGCVHVPLNALRDLFNWVKPGTAVEIS